MCYRVSFVVSVAVLVMSGRERAARADVAPVTFPKGTLTLQTGAAFATSLEEREEDITSGSVGVGYFVLDNLSLNIELSGYRAIQTGEDAWIGGIAAALHHHLIRFDRYTIFADVNFGPVWATEPVPADGTRFNFITRFGAGMTAQLTADLHLVFGARYFHLSNARIDGADKNPNINGIEGHIGLMWILH